jgi:hypothetical protein
MHMNPEWNASYLRQPAMPTFIPGGYGVGGEVEAVSGAVSAVSGVASAWIGLKSQREQTVADEKSQRLQAKQQRESDISTQNIMTVSLLQQQEDAKSRQKTTKLLVTGIGLVAVLAVLGFVAIQALKQP